MSVRRTAMVSTTAGDDPLQALLGNSQHINLLGTTSLPPIEPAANSTTATTAAATTSSSSSTGVPFAATASPASMISGTPAPSPARVAPARETVTVSLSSTPLHHVTDPDDIVVDSERALRIATRMERKEHTPLYVGVGNGSGSGSGGNQISTVSSAQPSPTAASATTTTHTPHVTPARERNIHHQHSASTANIPTHSGIASPSGGLGRDVAGSVMTTSGPPLLPPRPTAVTYASGMNGNHDVRNGIPSSPTIATSSSSSNASSHASSRRPSTAVHKLPLRARDWAPSLIPTDLSRELPDDWLSHGRIPGEKSVMQIPDVMVYNALDDGSLSNSSSAAGSTTTNSHAVCGTLYMTSYQLYLEPTQKRDRLGQSVIAIPLSTIDRIELEKSKSQGGSGGGGSNNNNSAASLLTNSVINLYNYSTSSYSTPSPSSILPPTSLHYLDIYSKDGRSLRYGFVKLDEARRAYDCLGQYVFPSKDDYLFAFYYRLKIPIPAEFDGWNLYDPLSEFRRQGINTKPLTPPESYMSDELRLSWANESFTMCPTYPRVFVVPSEKYISDLDLLHVATFRSRGRIPVCTWKHPNDTMTIWRSSQPKIGMNNTRNIEDERLLSALTPLGDYFVIYDCRPRFNARANILAGKGFENPDLYRNCVKKLVFCDIHNIHVMRESYQKLVRACQKDTHDSTFLTNVAQSGWLGHISTVLKATADLVRAIDQDRLSTLIHCSDGWDRTAQVAALAQLCLDPYFRTSKGFFVLVEKEWLSYGHQFTTRTGHRNKNYQDDQRSCIFLQWLDCVHQLTLQFPRHFEFNSHLLVTMVHHLYSCRFGTFFHNSDMLRRRAKMKEKTVSIWTYFICSPAAIAGEFTNALYCPNGRGGDESMTTQARYAQQQHAKQSVAAGAGGENDDLNTQTPSAAASSIPILQPILSPSSSFINSSAASASQQAQQQQHTVQTPTSDGRGGGAGGYHVSSIGTVLYPTYSLKCIHLWSDYFLRYQNEQVEHYSSVVNHQGSIPGGGIATTKMYSSQTILQDEVRRLQEELKRAQDEVRTKETKQREMEKKLRTLEKEVKMMNEERNNVSNTNTTTDSINQTSSTSLPSSAGESTSSSALLDVPQTEIMDEDATSAAETAALEALRQRLMSDVVGTIEVPQEAPEDKNTL